MIIFANIRKLYDGSSSGSDSIHGAVDVFVDDGTIDAVKPHDAALAVGDAHTRIDCSDYTVTPGLVDCHGHITALGLAEADLDQMMGPGGLVLIEKVLFSTLVDGGVTTMRDIGGATHLMKRFVDEGKIIGPRLKIAICMLSTTGGHADFRGPDRCHAEISKLWPPGPGRPSSIVDSPWDCRLRVREIAASGADLIKICASPGVASPGDALEHREFHPKEVAALCEEATARGLRVAAHAHSISGMKLAIENGVHDLQHISFMNEELVDMASKAGCVVTPTSWVVNELQRETGLDPVVEEKVKQVAEVHQQAVEYAAKGGLPILMGTDPVLRGMHGHNYMELVNLIDDGLDNLQAWYGSTGLAAREIGQPDTGTIKPGQRADLLVCKSDVISDPKRIETDLVEVIKDGVAYRGNLTDLPQRSFNSTVDDLLHSHGH